MDKPTIEITDSARKFMDAEGIDTVTFRLFEERVGCCLGVVKEIEAVHARPQDAADYLCHCAEGRRIFISRRIRIIGPLKLATEGLWRKRLCLSGANVPLFKDW
jgi:hypothetical protein